MGLFNIFNGNVEWNYEYYLEDEYDMRALYQYEARKLILVPYLNFGNRIVIFSYDIDFYLLLI